MQLLPPGRGRQFDTLVSLRVVRGVRGHGVPCFQQHRAVRGEEVGRWKEGGGSEAENACELETYNLIF